MKIENYLFTSKPHLSYIVALFYTAEFQFEKIEGWGEKGRERLSSRSRKSWGIETIEDDATCLRLHDTRGFPIRCTRGCVTGALVRRSPEHARCESQRNRSDAPSRPPRLFAATSPALEISASLWRGREK